MSAATVEWILAAAYLFLGPLVWAGFTFASVKGRKRMDIVRRPVPPVPPPPPKISVLIPAKDEADQIRACVESVLHQDYPNFDVIVVDDRSTDGTGQILDEMAAADRRLKIVHLTEGSLPPGWGGKSFALHNGLMKAECDWLLFIDADVLLQPGVMTASIAWALKREFHLLSLLPRFVSGTFSEGWLQPLAGAATSGMFAIPLTNSPQWPTIAFANGQYLLVQRSAYDAVGGHEAIRGTLSEDVAIARRLKAAGFRPRLSLGDSWATVRMYKGIGAIFRGWSRNFYVGSLGKPWRILGLMAFMLLCCYSVFFAAAWGVFREAHPVYAFGGIGWIGASIAHYLLMSVAIALIYHWAGEPTWYALLLPAGVAFLFAVCFKSLWICATGRVTWRGTEYSAHQLGNQTPEPPTHADPQRSV